MKLEFIPCFPRYQQVSSLKYFLLSMNLQFSEQTQWTLKKCFILSLLCYIIDKNMRALWRDVLGVGERCECSLFWKIRALWQVRMLKNIERPKLDDYMLYFPNLNIFESKMRCHYYLSQDNEHDTCFFSRSTLTS